MGENVKASGGIVAVACDHGGLALKRVLAETLEAEGCTVLDLGVNDETSVDYPDYADRLAAALAEGKAARGVLVCGSGIGISIAANRHAHIRCALIHDAYGARMCRQHNDANVIAFGGRTTGDEVAKDCLRIFLTTPFEGGRHQRRVDKLGCCC